MRLSAFALLALAGLASAQGLPKQARDRHEYDLIDVDWSLKFDFDKASIQGDVTNTVATTKDAPLLVFDCAKLTVDRVMLDGKPTSFKTDGRVLAVASTAKKGTVQKVEIAYHGLSEAGIYFVPAARAFPAHTPIVYTQGEMEDTRYWLPTYDDPDDKATSRGTVTVPTGWSVLSNGALSRKGDTFTWTIDKPHSTYLISFVAGPYTESPDGTDPVPVSYWSPKGLEEWGKNAFGGTDAIIRCYAKLTGTPYPWNKYAQAAVADFMFGGMENVTSTTQTIDALFPDSVKGTRDSTGLDAHELAHQWFGDLVTTPRWDDVWINEGWATFMPTFYARERDGEDEFALERHDILEEAKDTMRGNPSRSMVYSGWKIPMEMFDGYAYPGGAARMFALMHRVGEPAFWKATQAYLAQDGYRNVDTAEFFRSYSKSLGTDLSTFETQWFRTPSLPPSVEVRRDGGRVTLRQTQPKPFALDLDVWALGADDAWTKRTVEMTGKEAIVDGLPDGPVLVDAEAWLPIDVRYRGLSSADALRLWRHAPNDAAKLRLADVVKGRPESDALIQGEPSQRLKARLVGGTSNPALLLGLSEDADARIAQAALDRMGAVPKNDGLVARLREVWRDRAANPDLRLSALKSLYGLDADPALIDEASKTDRFDDAYRVWALERLAEANPERAREMALAALKGGTTEPVRLAAIRVLGRVKDKPGERIVFDALVAMMGERSNSPLRTTIAALADYGDPAAIPYLEKRRDHSLHFVRNDVAEAIRRLGKQGDKGQALVPCPLSLVYALLK